MASEEKIVNKIVPIETIIEAANFLEDQKDEYARLIDRDKEKNQNLSFKDQVFDYKGDTPKLQYTIKFKDGREVTEEGYNWFIGMIGNLSAIERISMNLYIYYSSNSKDSNHYEHMRLHAWIYFHEDHVSLQIDGKNTEETVYKVHSYLKGLIENNEDRYNKTVKNRNLRIQAFSFSIGIILSYILYFILSANVSALGPTIANLFNNKIFLIIGQWLVAGVLGNIFGFPIMSILYRTIVPKTKYSHYSRASRKSVYVDNIEDYTSKDEVQIGQFANNKKKRATIEKIYKITRIIVLVQLVISVLLFIFMK